MLNKCFFSDFYTCVTSPDTSIRHKAEDTIIATIFIQMLYHICNTYLQQPCHFYLRHLYRLILYCKEVSAYAKVVIHVIN